ncbi:hypothetical protein PGT21_016099 [Puccinia graminis f. sp. tritici]|uniref:Uncharacterized protein n=1 Tax=Puccinia graminis f. sp. tritici TaxID=56615 RepID=A0A5B0M2I2_PUCGR|nr:hypothetical protein PGT21_016099 [Puccinia graminis f. sp. tritici]KAA1089842.1 hypothetical protein PGTUg99_022559 [Puccinia graminis f. sp. tritici]
MYLVNWKDFLPAGEVHVPQRLEGNPSSRPSTLPAPGILWDTRLPASFLRKRGHPHLLVGIRQGIEGIRNGYPLTISRDHRHTPISPPHLVRHSITSSSRPTHQQKYVRRGDGLNQTGD